MGLKEKIVELIGKTAAKKIADRNENEALDKLEKQLLEKINRLGIGPMGLGGKTTALAVKIAGAQRHPASYFVAIK
jgi:fumarate hydratase subunit alpha